MGPGHRNGELISAINDLVDGNNNAAWTTTAVDLYLDGTSGNDDNDGTEDSAPVKTWARMLELIPAAITNQVVTVHLAAGTYDADVNGVIELDSVVTVGLGRLKIQGSITQVGSGSVTDANPLSDSWHIEDTAASFTSADVGRIMRLTSGVWAGDSLVIVEVVSSSTVRVHRPDYPGTPYLANGDTYTLHNLDSLIVGTSFPGPLTRHDEGISTKRPGLKLRLELDGLKVKGGCRISQCSADVVECVFYQGTNNLYSSSWAIWARGCDLGYWAAAAVPDGVCPANATGLMFTVSEIRQTDLSGNTFPNASFGAYGWTSAGVWLSDCDGSIGTVGVADSDELSMENCNLSMGVTALDNTSLDIKRSTNVLLYMLTGLECPVNVRGGRVKISPYVSCGLDGNDATTGIAVTEGGYLEVVCGGAVTFTVQQATGSGIVVNELSSFRAVKGVISNDNGAHGLEAVGARLSVEDGFLVLDGNTDDGANLVNCTGSVKVDSDNNGGWGLQALKASQVYDLGSTFSGNSSGTSNTDASSSFVT